MSVFKLSGQPELGQLRIRCPLCHYRAADLALGFNDRLIAKCLRCRESLAVLKALDLPSRPLFSEEKEHFLEVLLQGEYQGHAILPDALPADDLDRWYRRWLALYPLSYPDLQALRARGFDDQRSWINGYGSWTGQLVRDFKGFPTVGLPGVHQGRVSLAQPKYAGILVPVRDYEGRIIALKVRLSHPDEKGKMRSFSSASFGGPKALYAPHCPVGLSKSVRAQRASFSRRVVLVEGELKADLVFAKTGQPTIGIPGANGSPALVGPLLDELQVEAIDLAFDMDPAGHRATARYAEHYSGLRIRTLAWPNSYKGPDDALNAGASLSVV